MELTPALCAELVDLVARRTNRARVKITGTSMRPLLRAGMVVDVEPLTHSPRLGDVLVFKSQRGLVAHRVVGSEYFAFRARGGMIAHPFLGDEIAAFVTSGDAHPDRAERVPPSHVVGRVSAVWSSAEPNARRLDDRRYYRRGAFLARTRKLRSHLKKIRAYLAAVRNGGRGAPGAFSVLVAATYEFERGRHSDGVALLNSLPLASMLRMARRHRTGGLISQWLDEAAQAGVAVPSDLHAAFRRVRWMNALQAGRVLACVRGVRDRFESAGIPHIFLKGGARLAVNAPGAELQFSSDVDVIVPAGEIENALAVLRAAGYEDIIHERGRAKYRSMQHREPLVSPDGRVPVEVHVALAVPSGISRRLDYTALESAARPVVGPVGEVRVLDDLAAAIHLAYHARDLHVWRDIVLLSRALRTFDPETRARFDAQIRAETRDGLRLRSAVAAADTVTSGAGAPNAAVRRYLAWVTMREEIPRRYAHTDIVEAIVGRCVVHRLQFRHGRRDPASWARCWLRNIVLLPLVARTAIRQKGLFQGG